MKNYIKNQPIKYLVKSYSSQIARLHFKEIPEGFISLLGSNFVLALYKAISKDDNSFCLVAEENSKVIGFIAFTENLNKLFKSAIMNNGIRLALAIGFKIFYPSVCKRILQNIFYPGKTNKMNLPKAELLSVVVDSAYQGKGIAKQLCQAGLEECRKRGIDKVKVLVAADNVPANKLYRKCGFKLAAEINNHGVPSNIYVADLTKLNNV